LAALGAQRGGDAADDNIRPRRAPGRAVVGAVARAAAAAIVFTAAVAAASIGQKRGEVEPALAGGPRARSSRPPRVQSRQRLRGGEPAPSVWARALAAAGDSSREKLGSARARAEPRRNRPPAPRLSGGSAPDFQIYRMAKH